MEITVEQFEKLNDDEKVVFDIRPETDRAYGFIPDSVSVEEDELRANPPSDKSKKIVVYCAKGILSIDIAEWLFEQGYDAYSLQGGYSEYLRVQMQKQVDDDFCKRVEQSLTGKFKKDIFSKFYKAIKEYELIREGDRIAVCISGGKDSMLMAKLFQEYKRHSNLNFDVKYLVMDPGYAKTNREIIEENARRLHVPITIFETDIFESVYNVDKSPCYLCARMRRGYLYNFAKQLGCNKIALGHHFNDVIETTLMSMLYGAEIKTMLPKLHSTNFAGMELIRPLYLVREEDIISWGRYNNLRFLQCACRFTERTAHAEEDSARREMKRLIAEMKQHNKNVDINIFRSMHNVNLATAVGYRMGDDDELHSFLEKYDEKEEM